MTGLRARCLIRHGALSLSGAWLCTAARRHHARACLAARWQVGTPRAWLSRRSMLGCTALAQPGCTTARAEPGAPGQGLGGAWEARLG